MPTIEEFFKDEEIDDLTPIEYSQGVDRLRLMKFCEGFYDVLLKALCNMKQYINFFICHNRPEDLYIVVGNKNYVLIQLEPYCEVICLEGAEFTTYEETFCEEAITYMKETLIEKGANIPYLKM